MQESVRLMTRAVQRIGLVLLITLLVTGVAFGGGQGETAQDDRPELTEDPSAGNIGTIELFEEMTPADDAVTVDTSRYAKDGPYTVGFAGFGLVNSWRVQAVESTKLLAENIGVELRITDAGGDATKQISDAEDLLAQGVDALLISPVAREPLAPIIERAYNSGIPVVVWGSEAATDQYTAQIVTDDWYFGYAGGQKLVEDMGGSGNVIMLRGIAGNSVEQARYEGAVAALDEAEGEITIVGEEYGDWAFDQGKAITETFLAANPNIDGVWASGAAMTRGAIEAFQEAGLELVPMSGENLNGFLKLWAELDLESSGPQFPTWQAPEALKLAVHALQGREIMSSYRLTPPPIVDAESAVLPDISDDYWVEQYLQKEQVQAIFPN